MNAPVSAFNLNQFQADLARRIEAATARDTQGSRIGFRAGERNWLAPLEDIQEVIALPPLAAVPGAQRWFLGMVNVRGTLYGVSDFADFLGLSRTPRNAASRLLVPHARLGVNAALLIQNTLGLANLATYETRPAADSANWCRQNYADASGADWCDLDLAALFADPAFLRVERVAD